MALLENKFNTYDLCVLRGQMLEQIYHKLKKILNFIKIIVNYLINKVIISSHSNITLTKEDDEKVIKFEANFNNNNLEICQDKDASTSVSSKFCR